MNEKEANSEIRLPCGELVVSLNIYMALKKYDLMLAVLNNSSPREPQERLIFGELSLSLRGAVARIKTGDTPGAMEEFKRAYSLSFGGVFEMPFIELGKNLHPLTSAALHQTECGIPNEWLKIIDRKASIYAKKTATILNLFKHEKNIKDNIHLTDREQEVLIDLHHGLSRDEIALNRYLSINTVKTILRSIYIKLDANNNVDAVRIALEKNLIE